MATTNCYDIGDVVRLIGEFKDTDGNYVDPTDVIFTVEEPDGTLTEKTLALDPAEVIKDAVGQYHWDFTPTQSGTHKYRTEGTIAAQGAAEEAFYVQRRTVADATP